MPLNVVPLAQQGNASRGSTGRRFASRVLLFCHFLLFKFFLKKYYLILLRRLYVIWWVYDKYFIELSKLEFDELEKF